MLTKIYISIPFIWGLAYVLRKNAEARGRKYNLFEILLVGMVMVLPVGLNEVLYVGENDRYMYVHYFLNVFPPDITMCRDALIQLFPEMGWGGLNVFIKYFVANDERIFIFLVCVICVLPVVYRFSKDFEKTELSLLLFVFYGSYLQSLNGMRQTCAVAVLICGYHLLVNGSIFQFMMVVLLAGSFHMSAFIFILLLPFRYVRIDGLIMKALIIVSGVGWLLYNPLVRFLCMMFPDSRYVQNYSTWLMGEVGRGANPIRVLWIIIPLGIAFLNREKIEKEEGFRFIFNLSVINVIIMLFASKTWILARFNIYFSMFGIYLIYWELKYLCQRRKYIWGYLGIVLFYGMYMLLNYESMG